MQLQQLYSLTRQAIQKYNMISDGDVIAVGISGGKDSLTLLYALSGLRKFYPASFTIKAITVDLGYDDFDLSKIEELCKSLDVEYKIVHTNIKDMLPKENPCSLCARLRKGALISEIKNMGCNKVAYAHHMDDVIETMMLSLIYEGRFSSFWPVTHLDDTNIDIIRPLIFVPEANVIGFKNKYALPVVTSPCPYEPETERAYIKNLIRDINNHTKDVKKRLMTAIVNGNIEGWTL